MTSKMQPRLWLLVSLKVQVLIWLKNRVLRGGELIAWLVVPLLLSFSTPAFATVSITTTSSAATLATSISAGNSGITLTGTPVLTVGGSATVAGTFTSTSSNLGIAGGIVLGTGNTSLIPGSPLPAGNLNTPGTGISNAAANEFDVATFTFSFIPNPGVIRMSIASVFASEEYNEYVNTAFTDNFSMMLNGGAYTNLNVATIPGTSTLTDINSVNNGLNAGYYRDNSTATPTIPDIKMDGATRVFINAFNVVPGTTYTVTIRIADVGDAAFDSVAFISTSTVLNNPPVIDLSLAASGTGYATSWNGSAPVAIAATDVKISDDGTTISSATVTISNLVAGDLLTAGALPAGISASAYNAGTGVITLTGVATLAQYQTALQAIKYSSTTVDPANPAKLINVVINDGVDNSNTAVTTISIVSTITVVKTAAAPTVNLGTSATLTDVGDTITFTYNVTNSGAATLTGVVPVDAGPKFNGASGAGTLGSFSPASASIAAGSSQSFTAVYVLTATDMANGGGITNGVTNTATAKGTMTSGVLATSASANATTAITTVAALTMTKTRSGPTIAAGTNATFTDAGDTISYTFVIKNVGSVTMTNVLPVDSGPKFNGIAGTNALSAFTPATAVTLTAGASQTFTATYTLSLTDMKNGVGVTNGVSNTAIATGKSPQNATINSAGSTATTTIVAVTGMTLVKSFVLTDQPGGTAARADLNENIAYTYTVANTGNVFFSNVSIADLHGTPAALAPLGAAGITNETLFVPGPYGVAGSPDGAPNDGVWLTLAPGATIKFIWNHPVTQAEMDNG